ncbi:MAG TPA: PKD domain-containing protein, partial [Acidimicrobiia bacterium]|nr:PKD domain-containing protein [Acidimicrobiia bacterium]
TINNVAPTVTLVGANGANEGQLKSYSYTVSDPGSETFSRDAHSCGANGTLSNGAFNPASGAGSFDCSFPDGPNSSTVSVTISDGDGGSDSDSISVTINNVAPTVTLSGDDHVNEGTMHTYSFTVTDPGQDTFSVLAYGCGTGGTPVAGSLNTDASGGSFQCSFPDGPATTNVTIKVEDSDHAGDSDSEAVVVVEVANLNPVVTVSGPTGAAEGELKHYTFTTTDAGTETFTLVSSSCGVGNTLSNPAFTAATGAGSFDCSFADGPSNPTVNVTVSDGDGGSGSGSVAVTVTNVVPAVSLSGPSSVASGSTHTYSFTITDPGQDTQAYALAYPKCGANGVPSAAVITNTGGSFNCTFGIGPASSTVAVKVNDGDDDSAEASKVVTIAPPNHPPTVDAGTNRSGGEGSSIALDGTVSDPDGDSFTVKWTYATNVADVGTSCSFANDTAVDTAITCTDDGTYTATLTATDSKGASASDETTVTVTNANPVVTATNETPPPYAMATTVAVSANFTDAGANDTHRTPPGGNCTISWDDGTPSSTGVVTEANGNGSCSASHVYAGAGVYTVTITVMDDDQGPGSATVQVVVYNPNAGFVTGGGWVTVAAGSYPAGAGLSGRANFGFTSQYKKGATIPTGETEFNFQVADFKFHSASYQWLVVSGYKAQYKGTGEVNGVPGYDFRLTAYDGAIAGAGNTGQDKFRIKITKQSTGELVFDNRLGTLDDIDAADPQTISGGSIVIHKP